MQFFSDGSECLVRFDAGARGVVGRGARDPPALEPRLGIHPFAPPGTDCGIGWANHTPAPGTPHGGLHDSYALFTQLRQAGIRAHAWI